MACECYPMLRDAMGLPALGWRGNRQGRNLLPSCFLEKSAQRRCVNGCARLEELAIECLAKFGVTLCIAKSDFVHLFK